MQEFVPNSRCKVRTAPQGYSILRRFSSLFHGLTSIALAMQCAHVSAQRYPVKPVRIITSEVGSGTDFASRLIAQGLPEKWNQRAIVENRPSGSIPGEVVSTSAPDGYTLLLGGSAFWLGPLMRSTPYDPITQFAPITMAVYSPTVLVVHPSLPAKSVKDLIAIAKGKPGALNYASAGIGGAPHLAAELFKSMARIDVVRINYKGGAMLLTDLMAGQAQLSFGTAGPFVPHIKAGRLRALAVTSAMPSAVLPGLPTVAASGLPGYEAISIFGMFAPAKTPDVIVSQLHQEIVQFLNKADVKDKFLSVGVEVAGSTQEQFAATLKTEVSKWGKIIKDAGIRAD